MNRTISDATVKCSHHDNLRKFRRHFADIVTAYNFALRLNTLSGLTLSETICKAWTDESSNSSMIHTTKFRYQGSGNYVNADYYTPLSLSRDHFSAVRAIEAPPAKIMESIAMLYDLKQSISFACEVRSILTLGSIKK